MAQGKQQLKFEKNPCNNFKDNRCHRQTDGRRMVIDGQRMTDKFRFHERWHSQAQLKIKNKKYKENPAIFGSVWPLYMSKLPFSCQKISTWSLCHCQDCVHLYTTCSPCLVIRKLDLGLPWLSTPRSIKYLSIHTRWYTILSIGLEIPAHTGFIIEVTRHTRGLLHLHLHVY